MMLRFNINVKYVILSLLIGFLNLNSLIVNAQTDKKGLCLGVGTADFPFRLRLTKSKWHYGWNLRKSSFQPAEIPFVPMIYGNPSASTYTYLDSAYRAGDFTHLLAFNEPDAAEQGNVSVDQAIAAWPNMMNLGIPLGSPAATNAEGPWMTEFMSRASALNYRIDFVTVHSYPGPNAANFLALLKRVYALYNKPIWITEFAVADWSANNTTPNRFSEPQVLEFMKTVLTALETPEYSFVHRYSWFAKTNITPDNISPLGKSLFFDADGGLTYLGQYYANFDNPTPRVPLVNPLIAWNVFGRPTHDGQNIMPTTINAAIETIGFVRGTGITSASTNVNIWGGSGWSTETIDVGPAISQGKYLDFSISAKANKSFSLTKLGALKIITSSTGPIYFKLQYAIDNGPYKGITTLFVDRPTTTTVFFLDDTDLSIFSDLQDVAAGKTVKFRLIPFGATSTATSNVFYIGSNATGSNNNNSLGFEGSVKTIQNPTTTELANWNFANQTGGGTQGLIPAVLNSAVNTSGLVKGSGVTNVDATSDRLWGARGWSLSTTGPENGISNNRFFTFTFTPKENNFVSFTQISPLKIRVSSLGPINYTIQYAIGSGDYTTITTLSITRPSVTSNFTLPTVDLSTISELQNVSPNKNVTFRIIPWAASNNDFSHFYLGDASTSTITNSLIVNGAVATVLPVKLKNFTAKNIYNKAVLKWESSSEVNFSHYIIERKVGNGAFEEIKKVNSAGLTTGSSYSYTDEFVSFETHYYRLKMIDFDGTSAYSYIQFVSLDGEKDQNLSLYPNPVVSEVMVTYPIANSGSRLKIVGLDGKVHADYPLEEGSIIKKIDVTNLEKGYYIVVYNHLSTSKGLKFIKN